MKIFYFLFALITYSYSQDTSPTPTTTPQCNAPNTKYSNCTNLCGEKNCNNYNKPSPCFSLRCGPPACVCNEEYVFLSGEHSEGCVTKEQCPTLNRR
ncbi:unnamed protein product [Auanema sp. JU1783]|nr:unnamed protein product [Auanema sp. JU1783]